MRQLLAHCVSASARLRALQRFVVTTANGVVVGKNYRLQNIQLSKTAKPGGEYRARTGDLLVANQALSQLS